MTKRQWRTIDSAPKDGSDIVVQIHTTARAFWSASEQRWVLTRPIHFEYPVDEPTVWSAPIGSTDGEDVKEG